MPPPRQQQSQPQPHRRVTLAVVGDVHSQWDADSEAALAWLGADVAVFVGDFGEENVQLVQRIAALPLPKAVCLGNHDAWFSLTPNGRRRFARAMLQSSSLAAREAFSEAPPPGGSTPAIARQLDALGSDHVGYSSKRFPELGLTLVGARPFSKGGKQWSDVAEFYEEHYGVGGPQDSALRILDVALGAAEGDCKVVVAHQGPAGLGDRRHCICGVDWTDPEADHGDRDLQEALDMMHAQGLRIPLVLFGHMHSQLKGRGHRNMVEVDPRTGTVYLNAAVVPRVRSFPAPEPAEVPQPHESSYDSDVPAAGTAGAAGTLGAAAGRGSADGSGSSSGGSREETIKAHHFVLVELFAGAVAAARDVWVGVRPAAGSSSGSSSGSSRECSIVHQQELVRTTLTAAAGAAAAEGSQATSPAAAALAVGPLLTQPPAAAAEQGEEGAEAEASEYVCSIYRAFTDEWEPFVLPLPLPADA
ncbi:hypothetical protein COHA_006475 [Chlorella ohadii]|uniref:Calcineurin-like phosphoesterase domain-containing protein n=1 Tax=Chlorella ohadii TaxID=2649997 RepID=A0AAD5DMG8_9CHLO|nr:hypothetical protein COHA_006475 [Chlorella ohadii]